MERRVIMTMNNQPLVSVPVITYNSAKFVLDTLESIKAQTYQNIELIMSDDCSTDNTVDLCQKWVEENKERFVRTQIITSEVNTGVSANLNRAEAACQGEWVKGIAGDDLLMPNCIADCVEYMQQHPNIIYLFGRIEAFGASEERNKYFTENIFDYSFFNLDVDGQLERLVFGSNCVPASTCFYNRQKAIELGIINDERIPLLEDWPKWINILKKGIKLEYIDEILVKYRLGGISTNNSLQSPAVHRSNRMFYYLYLYPERYKVDPINAILDILDNEECKVYDAYYNLAHSKAYKLGKFLLKPFSKFRNLLTR